MKVKDMNNKQHVQLTKVTDYDFVSAEKDKYGVFYSRDGLRLIDVDNKTFSCREYRIKESVKIICDYAFAGCSTIINVIIPDSVEVIGERAFSGCKSFKEIIIPKSVQYIDRLAFFACRNLKAVYIPDSVKRIGMYAFSDCQEITTVRRGRSIYREYESMGLIATPPGNKEKIERMLPKYLHDIIKELTYKEFINCNMQLYENIKTEREYDYNYLDRVKCPRCGDWYYVDDGVCDTCGYPWNE